MNFDVQRQDFLLASELKAHGRRRLQFVSTRRNDRIQRIVVRIGEKNRSRGGVDKVCRFKLLARRASGC